MELKLEFSARDWYSRFMGTQKSEHQITCEKGKKPMTSSDVSSSKKGVQKLPMSCARVKECGDSSIGKKAVLWRGSEVEELSERLKVLEEETEVMKEAFFWSIEERKNMMQEIYQQFQLLHGCLKQRSHLVIEECSCVNPFEDGWEFRKSLPDFEIPYRKPCLLTRELRANALAIQDPARCRGHIKFHHD